MTFIQRDRLRLNNKYFTCRLFDKFEDVFNKNIKKKRT